MTTEKALKRIDEILLDGKFIHYGFALVSWDKGMLEAMAAAHNPIGALVTFDEEDFETIFPAIAVIAKTGGLNVAVVASDKRPERYQCGRVFSNATVIDCFSID